MVALHVNEYLQRVPSTTMLAKMVALQFAGSILPLIEMYKLMRLVDLPLSEDTIQKIMSAMFVDYFFAGCCCYVTMLFNDSLGRLTKQRKTTREQMVDKEVDDSTVCACTLWFPFVGGLWFVVGFGFGSCGNKVLVCDCSLAVRLRRVLGFGCASLSPSGCALVSILIVSRRVNLSRRGVLLDSHLCPLCNAAMEDVQHVFFRCDVARVVLRKICRWWDLDWQEICSFLDWDAWFLSFRLSSRLKSILEVKWISCKKTENQAKIDKTDHGNGKD
ncbi:RNA-directed DNA polymerase, eukaryota [Tanacetum coccineum]